MIKFTKACDSVFTEIDDRHEKYIQENKFNYGKPTGIWFSPNYQWHDFIKHDTFEHTMILEIPKDFYKNNIYYLNLLDTQQFKSFMQKYQVSNDDLRIDWNLFAKDFDGIFIDNVYNWKFDNDFYKELYKKGISWVYSLDVDSLVIWKWRKNKEYILYQEK
jgi:hypothetical protein